MTTSEMHQSRDTVGAWIVRLLKGLLIGIGAITPGLSGGALMAVFGVYEPLIRFLANLRVKFLDNVRFFLPVGIGIALGVLAFSAVVDWAFISYAAQFTWLFIGFISGTFPSLYKISGKQGRKVYHWALLVVVAIATLFLMRWMDSISNVTLTPSIFTWLLSGALIGLGVIVPGMSPSNFLIYFGLYDKMAAGIAAFDLGVIIPLTLGLVVCVLLFAKAAAWAFDNYYAGMYHFILGMVVGSSAAIFPTVVFPAFSGAGLAEQGLSLSVALSFAVAMFVVGTAGSWLFSKLEDRVSAQRESLEAAAKATDALENNEHRPATH